MRGDVGERLFLKYLPTDYNAGISIYVVLNVEGDDPLLRGGQKN